MTEQIVSRAAMFERGVAAAHRGASRNSHNMNPWAPAVAEWLAGFDAATELLQVLADARPQLEVAEP